jgi:hypothetical protein
MNPFGWSLFAAVLLAAACGPEAEADLVEVVARRGPALRQ